MLPTRRNCYRDVTRHTTRTLDIFPELVIQAGFYAPPAFHLGHAIHVPILVPSFPKECLRPCVRIEQRIGEISVAIHDKENKINLHILRVLFSLCKRGYVPSLFPAAYRPWILFLLSQALTTSMDLEYIAHDSFPANPIEKHLVCLLFKIFSEKV